ncbi:hypothetical protein CLOM_g7890 [Closterium sp. NIES-68]|nr:hypothetical protein CLOM_g7890 [Closterium sp. NIES-68]
MGLLRHVKQGLAVSLDGELVMSGRWSGGRVLDACGCRKELVLRNGDVEIFGRIAAPATESLEEPVRDPQVSCRSCGALTEGKPLGATDWAVRPSCGSNWDP